MAKWNTPHRFNVYGVEFDVCFQYDYAKLEYGNLNQFYITFAFARKVGIPETLAVKTIHNSKDNFSYIRGQREAFERLVNVIWSLWGISVCGFRKDFSKKAWELSDLMGMWNMDEE